MTTSICMSSTMGEEGEIERNRVVQSLYPELQPLLILQLPDDWEKVSVHDGYVTYGVSFYYRDNRRNSVMISFWDSSQKYQTWVYGVTDEQYLSLQDAIERLWILINHVTRGVHYTDIATIKNEEDGRQLVKRIGIGGGTITRLLDTFGTLQKFQEASINELEGVLGIGSDKAWLIFSHLHSNVRYHELWDPNNERWVNLYQIPEEVLNQCVKTHTYLTQTIRNKYRLTNKEIKERGLVKVRNGGKDK